MYVAIVFSNSDEGHLLGTFKLSDIHVKVFEDGAIVLYVNRNIGAAKLEGDKQWTITAWLRDYSNMALPSKVNQVSLRQVA